MIFIYVCSTICVVSYLLREAQTISLEHAILGFLSGGARSGYDLKTRCFDVEARAFWTADQAQIYRTLERLSSAKLLTATRRRQVGKPDRKVYQITTAGRDVFSEWERVAASLPSPRDAFLLQVYFAADLTDPEITELLTTRRLAHQERLEALRLEAVEASRDKSVSARTAVLRQAAYAGATATERAAIDWLDDMLDAISAGLLPGSEMSGTDGQSPLFGLAPA